MRSSATAARGRNSAAWSARPAARRTRVSLWKAAAWLRADVDFWARYLANTQAAAVKFVAATLRTWLEQPAFAPIRDDARLRELDPAEAKELSALWWDVRDVLKRAQSLLEGR